MRERKRFNVINCGRRWGKTDLAKELLCDDENGDNGALNGYPVAYFAPTYKMLMEVWRAVNTLLFDVIHIKNEQEKRIELIGGGTITFWSLDAPDTIRGGKYKRVVIDEAAIVPNLKAAWSEVIRPMLADLRGDAWFFSTPKGKNYFYELHELGKTRHNWASWTMPTSTNPYIAPEEIQDAKETNDPLSFAQEFEAEFVTANLDSWAYCFEEAKHVKETGLDRSKTVYLSFDFNRNPISCFVAQEYNNAIFGIEMIKLNDSDIYKLCEYITTHYHGCLFIVTGDATGQASTALVQDNLNYYKVIRAQLRLAPQQLKVPKINPKLSENKVLVNSLLYNYTVNLDPVKCKGLIFDLENVKILPDGSIDKTDRKDPTKQADALDTFRYFCNTFFSWFLNKK